MTTAATVGARSGGEGDGGVLLFLRPCLRRVSLAVLDQETFTAGSVNVDNGLMAYSILAFTADTPKHCSLYDLHRQAYHALRRAAARI